ncbi:hypothetical protein [Pedobacter sp. Leaf250]|uniref:hypothetical protein n=1 Tax=Pedobacter sp. Leaf250 TaxID=2876559 RepID=UPI001E469D60|nr:hypothetical protein [Pedobacter sp. Leaf250]
MKIDRLLIVLSLGILFTACKGQGRKANQVSNSSTEDTVKQFIIGNYMIVPESKEVRTYKMIGGANWDGFTFEKDPKINYNTTTLLALGNNVFFKEYFPFNFDVDKLKIFMRDEFYFLCRDDKNIYYTSAQLKPVKIDISNFDAINDFVYKSKKNGKLFFLDIKSYQLLPVEIEIDEKSITHIATNYFYDKNGLYFFGEHSKLNSKGYYDDYFAKSEKLIDAQNIKPIISKKYFFYNKQVFATDDNNIKKLTINGDKIIEININSTESFITDGKTIYSDLNYGYDDNEHNEKGYYGIWYPALYSNIDLQKIYSPQLYFQKSGNSVVFNKYDPNNFQGLIARINNGYFLLADKKKTPIEKMLFYHPETKSTEIFEEKYLKIYPIERFLQYKNVLYFEGIPVETSKLNMSNLREIKNSNYLTDGKSLIYLGNIGGYGNIEKDGIEYAEFNDRIIENVYTANMKPINADLLSDGLTLISSAQKIKIKRLGLNVKIVE